MSVFGINKNINIAVIVSNTSPTIVGKILPSEAIKFTTCESTPSDKNIAKNLKKYVFLMVPFAISLITRPMPHKISKTTAT